VFNQSCDAILNPLGSASLAFFGNDGYAITQRGSRDGGLPKLIWWFLPRCYCNPTRLDGLGVTRRLEFSGAGDFPMLSVVPTCSPLLIFGIGPWPKLGVTERPLATSSPFSFHLLIFVLREKYRYLRSVFAVQTATEIWSSMLRSCPAGAEFVLLLCLHHDRLCDHSKFRSGSTGWLRLAHADAGALFGRCRAEVSRSPPVVGQNSAGTPGRSRSALG